jgi:Na+/H+-dicarboxylate symporter
MIIAPLVFTTLVVGIANWEMLAQWVELERL